MPERRVPTVFRGDELLPDYPFRGHYLTLGSHKLHYLDEGEGPVVVMVHGNPTWSYLFRHCITALSATHRVIAVDHMGCGLSDKPQQYPYTLRQHSTNLAHLLDHLQVPSYSLVVHDWGGAIGLDAATRAPERLEKVVITNTAAFRSRRIPLRIRICRWPLVGPLLVRGCNGFAWPATFMAVNTPLAPEVARAYLSPYSSWANRVAIAAFVRDIPLSPGHPSYGDLTALEMRLSALHDFQIPMLILWGGKDFCFTDHFFRQWQQRFPLASSHHFPHAGHYLFEDLHGEIEPILAEFLNEGRQP